jgi:hypothetical protein
VRCCRGRPARSRVVARTPDPVATVAARADRTGSGAVSGEAVPGPAARGPLAPGRPWRRVRRAGPCDRATDRDRGRGRREAARHARTRPRREGEVAGRGARRRRPPGAPGARRERSPDGGSAGRVPRRDPAVPTTRPGRVLRRGRAAPTARPEVRLSIAGPPAMSRAVALWVPNPCRHGAVRPDRGRRPHRRPAVQLPAVAVQVPAVVPCRGAWRRAASRGCRPGRRPSGRHACRRSGVRRARRAGRRRGGARRGGRHVGSPAGRRGGLPRGPAPGAPVLPARARPAPGRAGHDRMAAPVRAVALRSVFLQVPDHRSCRGGPAAGFGPAQWSSNPTHVPGRGCHRRATSRRSAGGPQTVTRGAVPCRQAVRRGTSAPRATPSTNR